MNEMFYLANEEERIAGYKKENNRYQCLFCDYQTEEGIIYKEDDCFMDAKRYMEAHIEKEHEGVFNCLIELEKKESGLSQHQAKILSMFSRGMTDYEIQQALNIGSISTVRNHRFALKEKERQAKVLSTIMALVEKNSDVKNEVKPHNTATMVDDRYAITLEESMEVIDKYFPNGVESKLKSFHMKEKYKLVILREIIKRFEVNRQYSEREVDTILKEVYSEDHAVIRRYMIQYGFLDREKDGSAYWVKKMEDQKGHSQKKISSKVGKKKIMEKEKKQAMKRAYMAKESSKKIRDGVFCVKNKVNNKVYIGTSRDVDKLEGIKFQLQMGSFPNQGLQKEWIEYGEENYEIAILDFIEREAQTPADNKELKKLEKAWKEKLQPYGDKGYHKQR